LRLGKEQGKEDKKLTEKNAKDVPVNLISQYLRFGGRHLQTIT